LVIFFLGYFLPWLFSSLVIFFLGYFLPWLFSSLVIFFLGYFLPWVIFNPQGDLTDPQWGSSNCQLFIAVGILQNVPSGFGFN